MPFICANLTSTFLRSRRKLLMDPAEVEHGPDPTHEVIGRHHVVEVKLIEELTLPVLPPPHHSPAPQLILLKQRNHGSTQGSTGVLQHVPPERWAPRKMG